jgi:hypothetical protein
MLRLLCISALVIASLGATGIVAGPAALADGGAPVITGIDTLPGDADIVNVIGHVGNCDPSTTTVTITGVLGTKTVGVDENGDFIACFLPNKRVAGFVTAVATSGGQVSDPVHDFLGW